MEADTPDSVANPPSPSSRFAGPLRRVGIAFGVLVAGWIILTQLVPRAFFPPPEEIALAPSTQPSVPPPSSAPVEKTSALPEETPAEELPPAFSEQTLLERVEQLEARVAQLEAQQPAIAVDPEALRSMEDRLRQQEQQAQSLKESLSEEQNAAWRVVALWQAYDVLEQSVRSGGAYTDALMRVSAQAGDTLEARRAIEALRPHAEEGIVSLDFLRQSFADIIGEALRTPVADNAEFSEKIGYNLSSLITIRKVGAVEGNSLDAIIARAEVALKEGDIKAAVKEITSLSEGQRQAFSAWLEQAQGMILAEDALQSLRRILIMETENSRTHSPSSALPASDSAL